MGKLHHTNMYTYRHPLPIEICCTGHPCKSVCPSTVLVVMSCFWIWGLVTARFPVTLGAFTKDFSLCCCYFTCALPVQITAHTQHFVAEASQAGNVCSDLNHQICSTCWHNSHSITRSFYNGQQAVRVMTIYLLTSHKDMLQEQTITSKDIKSSMRAQKSQNLLGPYMITTLLISQETSSWAAIVDHTLFTIHLET